MNTCALLEMPAGLTYLLQISRTHRVYLIREANYYKNNFLGKGLGLIRNACFVS